MKKLDVFKESNSNLKNRCGKTGKRRLADANLSDDVLFSLLMQREEFCKIVLSIILDVEVVSIKYNRVQESMLNLPGYKSVRLDVFIETANGELFNIEMQKSCNDNIPKRARFYQGILDISSLMQGKEVKYRDLPKTIVIFITGFDPFGKGLYRYTFKNTCMELPGLSLGDESIKMFLNTKGTNQNKEPDTLIQFLKYISDSKSTNAKGNLLLEKLDEQFQLLKKDSKLEVDYMRTDWIEEEALERGIEKGMEKGIEKGMEIFILEGIEDGKPQEVLLSRLQKRFNLNEKEAKEYLKKYSD